MMSKVMWLKWGIIPWMLIGLMLILTPALYAQEKIKLGWKWKKKT